MPSATTLYGIDENDPQLPVSTEHVEQLPQQTVTYGERHEIPLATFYEQQRDAQQQQQQAQTTERKHRIRRRHRRPARMPTQQQIHY